MYCSKCGFKNNDDSKFCASCGSSLTGLNQKPVNTQDNYKNYNNYSNLNNVNNEYGVYQKEKKKKYLLIPVLLFLCFFLTIMINFIIAIISEGIPTGFLAIIKNINSVINFLSGFLVLPSIILTVVLYCMQSNKR